MKNLNLSEIEINVIIEALTHRANEAYKNGEEKTLEMCQDAISDIKAQIK